MDAMFWVWLGIIIVSLVFEFATMEMVSVWFTAGAIVPFILAATKAVGWEIQLVIFVVLSAVLMLSLRGVTKKLLLRNVKGKANLESLIGREARMLDATDFDTVGSLKINGLVWSAVSEDGKTEILSGEIVEIVKVDGNKLLVRKINKKSDNK